MSPLPRLLLPAFAVLSLAAQEDAPAWRAAPPLGEPRAGACAVRLPDGRVLVPGGSRDEGPVASAEVFRYGPEESFEPVPAMQAPRAGHACVLLGDGRVLVAGGEAPGAPVAELYDPS